MPNQTHERQKLGQTERERGQERERSGVETYIRKRLSKTESYYRTWQQGYCSFSNHPWCVTSVTHSNYAQPSAKTKRNKQTPPKKGKKTHLLLILCWLAQNAAVSTRKWRNTPKSAKVVAKIGASPSMLFTTFTLDVRTGVTITRLLHFSLSWSLLYITWAERSMYAIWMVK